MKSGLLRRQKQISSMNCHMKSVILIKYYSNLSGNQDKRGTHDNWLSEKEKNISISSRETKCCRYSRAHAIAEDFHALLTKLSAQGTPLSPPLGLQSVLASDHVEHPPKHVGSVNTSSVCMCRGRAWGNGV